MSCRIWGELTLIPIKGNFLDKLRHLLVQAWRQTRRLRIVLLLIRAQAPRLRDLILRLILRLRLPLPLCVRVAEAVAALAGVVAVAPALQAQSRLSLRGRALAFQSLIRPMGGKHLLHPTCVLQRG